MYVDRCLYVNASVNYIVHIKRWGFIWISFKMSFLNLLKHEGFCGMAFEWRDRNLSVIITNIFICVSMINKGLVGLERHEGDKLMTECKFLNN